MNLINFEALKEMLWAPFVQVGAIVLAVWVGAKVLKFTVVRGTVAAAHGVLYLCGWRKHPKPKKAVKPPYYESSSDIYTDALESDIRGWAGRHEAANWLYENTNAKLKDTQARLLGAESRAADAEAKLRSVVIPNTPLESFVGTQSQIKKETEAQRNASLFSGASCCTYSPDDGSSIR